MAAQQRPLSPHLQIYRRELTSVLSILHRATGVFLGIAAFALMAWLLAVAGGSDVYAQLYGYAASTPGRLVLLAVTASFFYHLLNGIRHLLWDLGWGFELRQVYATGWSVVILAVIITAVLAWVAMRAGASA